MRRTRPIHTTVLLLALSLGAGCQRASEPGGGSGGAEPTPAPTNRVDIPSAVRQNLGITFARVELRAVERTLRVPGHFELLPGARREYRSAVAGRVEVLVGQYAAVSEGTPLCRVDSPAWREVQRAIAEGEAAARLAQAAADSIDPLLAAHKAHHAELEAAVDIWSERVSALEALRAAGGARGDEVAQARAALAGARSDLAETLEKEAALEARRVEASAQLEAARSRLGFLFESASSLTGLSPQQLRGETSVDNPAPRWSTLGAIEVRAVAAGIVERLGPASGGVIEEHGLLLAVVQPDQVRFRAVGLQSDLPRLRDGQAAVVVSAQDEARETLAGRLTLAPTADPERRTVELVLSPQPDAPLPTWARAGVAAFLEVTTSGSGRAELAIPLRCVARDGTRSIIFRRDPANPDKVIRMEADLGLDDGRWVVVRSGVAEGNEVVLDGVYQLMVATSEGVTRGGHFHPDGTFHEGED